MNFENFIAEYLKKGLLQRQTTDWRAIKASMERSQKDLQTARLNLSIDEGIAFTVAYLAMLRAARAYILSKGFRPSDGYQHKTVIEFIEHSLGQRSKQLILRFDRMRRKRNIFTYEIGSPISKTEAESALRTATEFIKLINKLLRSDDPQFNLDI
jgi:uncharacterized protein (UPF0332 family)